MKRLFIDLEQCTRCGDCTMQCSYKYHRRNLGVTRLWEIANFALVCRRCEDEPCVTACPWDALEKRPDKVLERYNMRCTSCKSCAAACPFGTIYPATIPILFQACDLCVGRLKETEEPSCVASCPHGGIKYGEFAEEKAKNIYSITDRLVVYSDTHWTRV